MLSQVDLGPAEPCPTPFNMAAHVLAPAAQSPSRIALQILRPDGAERWSYARLEAAVRATGGGLLEAGLAPGDRVLMRLGSTVDFPIAYLGCIAAGLVPVPTAAGLTAPEVTRLAALIEPRLILQDPDLALPEPSERWPVMALAQLRALRDGAPCAWHMGTPDRLAYIIFTSGSSGTPRAVMHAHRAIWARRMMWQGWYGFAPGDRLMHAGAFNWTYTLGTGLMDPWAAGLTALIPDSGVTTGQLLLLMRRFDTTIFAAAPGVYRQILKHHDTLDLPHLRHGLSAGEKLPEPTARAWQAATGRPVFEALGMSECSTFISASPDHPAPHGSSGYAQAGRRIAVLGADGTPVARGTPGTLAVHADDPGLFLGYFGAPEATAAKFHGEWFLTGDTVTMDADGAITYLGRDDDMMNAGGFRVSPLEVEAVFDRHPQITECAACEVGIRRDASVIALFYVGSNTLDEAELSAHGARHLARYKQPRLFHRVSALPRQGNGKLQRRALREEWEANHGPA